MNFKVGQEVVCIKQKGCLIKDKIYTINDIVTCKCGDTYVSWGNCFVSAKKLTCCCGQSFKNYKSELYCFHWRFAPVKLDYEFVEEVIKQVEPQTVII